MLDWCADEPANGAGLLLTQVHESPPCEPGTAPSGKESPTQTVVLVRVLVPAGGGGVLVTDSDTDALPALSQVARPSNWLNDMPVMVRPSRPTWLAGTSSPAHWPATGSGPMERR